MTQYIPKSALVAEIKRRMNENRGKQVLPQYFGMMEEDLNILSFIDTLEVKEIGDDVGSSEGDWSSKTVQFIDADGNIKEITFNKAQKG